MKKLILLLTLCGLVSQVFAAEWLTDLPKAEAQAKLEKKHVLMDFGGSDWCTDCAILHKKVLDTPEFMKYAATNFVLVSVDFPEKKVLPEEQKKANSDLAKKFGVEGFPVIIIVDETGKELTRLTGYSGETPKDYIKKLNTRVGQPAFMDGK